MVSGGALFLPALSHESKASRSDHPSIGLSRRETWSKEGKGGNVEVELIASFSEEGADIF